MNVLNYQAAVEAAEKLTVTICAIAEIPAVSPADAHCAIIMWYRDKDDKREWGTHMVNLDSKSLHLGHYRLEREAAFQDMCERAKRYVGN